MPIGPVDPNQIVITASHIPEKRKDTAQSVTLIDDLRIERLGAPLVTDLLRLVPSIAVSSSGPAGSLTDVRIRGAEANHTLLFIDGIRANDPSSGDQPRFDLLNADIASRIEIIRGPQSALWGSEAIGGVVAVNGTPATAPGLQASAEGGSFGFARTAGSSSIVSDVATVAGALGFQRASGIDSFNGRGDKDGYRNLSGRIRASWNLTPSLELGMAGFAILAKSDFDGFDPVTFLHADTLDNSRNRLKAGRIWAQFGAGSSWSGSLSVSALQSSNRNYVANDFVNRTTGSRRTIDAQVERQFITGSITNRLILNANAEREIFHARDRIYGGASNQDHSREHDSISAEWRSQTTRFTGDVALRRDIFNRFKNATTLRASLLVKVSDAVALAGSYGEGISQPTFFDLYGFFPGSFIGNQDLKPETSRGFEASLRFSRGAFQASLTAYRQRLHDEIVPTFNSATFISSSMNSQKVSHRSGIETELNWQIADRVRLSANYSYLHATQPDGQTSAQVRELRRPQNSGSVALDGRLGRFTYGASLAFVGAHLDRNQDPPYQLVNLHSYWLAGARIGYALSSKITLFARAANAFNAHYEDVLGYRREGEALYAGIRFTSPG